MTAPARRRVTPSPREAQQHMAPDGRAASTRAALMVAGAAVAIVLVLMIGIGIGMNMSTGSAVLAPTAPTAPTAAGADPEVASDTGSSASSPFGASVEVAPGVTAKVEKPVRWKPSSIAAGADGAERVVRAKVTLTNRTGRYVNFSELVYTNMTIQGASTQSVTDGCGEQNGTCGLRNVATKPGGTETFGAAWVVPSNPVEVGLSVSTQDYSAPSFSWSGTA